MNWTATEIVFSFDGVEHHSFAVTPDMPFHQNFFIILNLAMGGVGNNIDPSFKSSSMEIDYIRVFQ